MTFRPPLLLVCGLLAGHLLGSAAGQAPSREELKQRFESRYPTLTRLKAAGQIGETWAGFVAVVDPESAQDRTIPTLVRDENRDRELLYGLLSDEIGRDPDSAEEPEVSPAVIAERNAWRNFQKASQTELLQVAEATWVSKMQRPWLLALLRLQDQGRLGETGDGFVAVVQPESAGDRRVSRVLELENEARRRLYEQLAAQEGVPLETVAARQARRQFKAAHRGVYLQAPDGTWQPKREPSGVLPAPA